MRARSATRSAPCRARCGWACHRDAGSTRRQPLSFIAVVPIGQVAEGQAFIAQVGEAIVGRGRRDGLVAVIVIVCVLGSLGAMQMIAPRLYVAMAQDGVFPAACGRRCIRDSARPRGPSRRRRCSRRVLVALGTFDTIVAFFVFITVVFIAANRGVACSCCGVVSRRSMCPCYPWPAVVFLALVAALLVLIGIEQPAAGAARLLLVVGGAARVPFDSCPARGAEN